MGRGLVKTFGRTRALDGLDLAVRPGEVHGFLGPNGSGKSTTIRVLLGLMRADAGTARLLGGDPWRDATALHRRIAYVPGDVTLWPNLTGGEVIDLLGRLRGGLDAHRRAELLDRFELDPRKKGRAYSKGNRQKIALVAALASDAELLILDEPTSGLDPSWRRSSRSACGRRSEAAGPSSCRATSSARWRPLRPRHDHPQGPDGRDRHARRPAAPDAHLDPRGTRRAARRRPAAERARRPHRREHHHVRGRHPELDAALQQLTRIGVRALTSRPPTLEELFLRHYQNDLETAS